MSIVKRSCMGINKDSLMNMIQINKQGLIGLHEINKVSLSFLMSNDAYLIMTFQVMLMGIDYACCFQKVSRLGLDLKGY